jgi:glycosyltransferase involved in cell wall biosynthesis
MPLTLGIVTHKIVKGDGQGRVNYEIALEALRQGHELILIATTIAPDLKNQVQVTFFPISTQGWPTSFGKNFAFAWKSAWQLKRQHQKIDVVLVNGAITWGGSDLNIAHFVHSSWLASPFHTSRIRRDLYGAYQWLYTMLNAKWEKQAFRDSKTIIAVSNQVRQDLISIGISEETIQVIYNGVDTEEFQPGAIERVSLGLPNNVFLALFAGDIRTPRKNLETILKALVNVPDLHLAVAGSTDRSPYPLIAEKLGLSDRVYFLGQRNDMPDLMKASDLFVFPSRYETFGLVILEALASGLPVITAKTVGASELINPKCGYVMSDVESSTELSAILQSITKRGEHLKLLGSSAQKLARQFTWRKMSKSYLDILLSLNQQEPS